MYPILGLTYMINKLGAVVEGVFFVGFAVMVVVQIHERLAAAAIVGRPQRGHD